MFPFNASINFGADNPVYIFKNANATLPSGVKKDFLPLLALMLLGFSSVNPNDIAISRREEVTGCVQVNSFAHFLRNLLFYGIRRIFYFLWLNYGTVPFL